MSDCINGEIISVTVTVDEETVIGTINTAARGPQGEPGTGGGGAWNELTGTADAIPFTLTTAPAHSEGKVYYDSTDHSLTYYVDEAEVAMNIGREMWIRVRNNSGSTIANGKVVYLSGATGQTPTIALARANALATSRVIGVATHDIENNSFGYVTTVGEVKGLNTSAYTDGVMLFLSASTAGELTTTAPTAPNRAIQVATVSHAHVSQGKLFCHPETDSVDSTGIADSTSIGRALVTAATASVGRTTLGSTATGDALFTAADMAAANLALGEIRSAASGDVTATTQNVWVDTGASVALTSGTWRVMAFYHGANVTSSATNVRLSASANWSDTNGRRIATVTGSAITAGPTFVSASLTSSAANFGTASLVAGEIIAIVKMTGSGTLSMQVTNTAATGTATSYTGNHLIALKIA